MRVFIKTPLVRALPSKSRPKKRHRPSMPKKRGNRMIRNDDDHPGKFHGPLRKKLRSAKLGSMKPKIAPWVTRGRETDLNDVINLHVEQNKKYSSNVRHGEWEMENGAPERGSILWSLQ